MAFAVKDTLERLQTYLAASGYVEDHAIGEPRRPLQISSDQLAGRVFMRNAQVVGMMVNGDTVEVHTAIVRLYMLDFGEDEPAPEYRLAEASSKIVADFIGEYDLGATIRRVDIAGEYGDGVGAVWGDVELGQTRDGAIRYRLVDINVPLIVDASATAAP